MSSRLLPVIAVSGPHGSRSRMTCTFRCGNACDHPEPNTSGNEHFHDLLARTIARRSVLGGAVTGSAAIVIGGLTSPAAATGTGSAPTRSQVDDLTFDPVAPNTRDNVVVPVGYDYDIVIGWGDQVERGAPKFDVYEQSAAAQAKQFGYNCDYVSVQRVPGKRGRFALVVNHEYTDEFLMFPEGRYSDNQVRRIAMMAHGMSVVEIERGDSEGTYQRVPLRRTTLNRRITVRTRFELTGPAAGDRRLKTSEDSTGTTVLGTLNNCAGGTTPWGTVLSGEENFNQYFEASNGLDPTYADSYARYGITGEPGRGWQRVDPRFDLSKEPHEPFRFGYIVELDPLDPSSTPKKRTMLGRFKHEGATIVLTEAGRVVAYSGDDERGDYMYKFVSRRRFRDGGSRADRRHNMRLLDEGTLYVARFRDEEQDPAPEYDGKGRWIPLCSDQESFVDGMSVADVLIDTRLAADTVSPTRMDRPEDVEVNPVNGRVYAALTNNSDRGTAYPTDEANPLGSSQIREEPGGPLVTTTGNRNGYVLEIVPKGGNHGSEKFRWRLMLVCGDPEAPETYFAGYPKDQVSPISCPDNVTFDGAGNLWISTDGNQLGSNDGMFAVPTRGTQRGKVLQFLTVPRGAETCGPLIARDGRTVFNAIQHPGEVDGASFENPASTWPHTRRYPIPSVIATHRVDGGRIGR
ncbi:MAG: PhoX family phosphatase [Actinomycetota bacterium]|nr:PhoX family phosphatase [Actinomycetota bacterium]